jgi:hypothetical protein
LFGQFKLEGQVPVVQRESPGLAKAYWLRFGCPNLAYDHSQLITHPEKKGTSAPSKSTCQRLLSECGNIKQSVCICTIVLDDSLSKIRSCDTESLGVLKFDE